MDNQDQNPIAEPAATPAPETVPEPAAEPVTQPAPAATPTFTSDPAPTVVPSTAPINPMGNDKPKKSKALIIITAIVVILAIVGAVVAIVLLNNKPGDSKDKTSDNTSKEKEKEKEKEKDPEPVKTSGKTIAFSFGDYKFNVGNYYGENVRAAAAAGKLYVEKDDWDYEELTDIDAHLSQDYTFSTDLDSGSSLPSVYLMAEVSADDSYVRIGSSYFSMGGSKTKKFSELDSDIYAWCGEGVKGSINDFDFECYKTTPADVKAAFPSAEKTFEDYENLEVKMDNFIIYIEFDSDNNTLDTVRIDSYRQL